MRLDEFAAGDIYCDVNVFYMFLRRDPTHHETVRGFFARMSRGEVRGFATPLTMDELFYRLLLARIRDVYDQNPLDVLRDDLPAALGTCADEIRHALTRLAAFPNLQLVGVERNDSSRMLDNVVDHALLPRDALHLAVMQRLGLTQLATDERDFDRVGWLQRHWIFNEP